MQTLVKRVELFKSVFCDFYPPTPVITQEFKEKLNRQIQQSIDLETLQIRELTLNYISEKNKIESFFNDKIEDI